MEDGFTELEFQNLLELLGPVKKDRADFVFQLAGRIDVPEKGIFVGTDFYMDDSGDPLSINKESLSKAVEIAKRARKEKEVIKHYEDRKSFLYAARIAASLGLDEVSKKNYGNEIAKIIKTYGACHLVIQFSLPEAARVAEEAGFYRTAMNFYQRDGELTNAKRLAQKLGLSKRALAYESAIKVIKN